MRLSSLAQVKSAFWQQSQFCGFAATANEQPGLGTPIRRLASSSPLWTRTHLSRLRARFTTTQCLIN